MAKTPKPMTRARLERMAVSYLERYGSTSANFKRVLWRKVDRALHAHPGDRAEWGPVIDALTERFVRLGYIDDRRYAADKAASLHRRAASSRLIRSKLFAKGVPAGVIDDVLAGLGRGADLVAARSYARKKRLGPWRVADREEHRERDLGRLGRRGFSWDVAVAVIDGEAPAPDAR